ncbi:FMN-binding protein [Actinoplanes sp. L3-i22]|uniref:FMN-binding protein n=1 Tax=Actinoplanes sp. L3-i22 TaxID=2836373 RepID=UPI001C84103F|nr:FMN-binding protein [Actinoplanes sp. L3-i22]
MRRITWWLFSTVAALVLLFSYRTSTGSPALAGAATTTISEPATTGASPSPTASAGTTTSPTTSGTGAAPTTSSSTTSTSTAAKTYTGSVAATRWGDVQVTITVANGKITDVAVPVYPSENGRDQEINAYALPVLRQETLTAQSAGIDTVSGATVTSNGYLESLQSALDAAHLS